jgi:hypothetical protein
MVRRSVVWLSCIALPLALFAGGCRKGGGNAAIRFFPLNVEGNSGALFQGPDLANPSQSILFGPGGPSGRVDGPLGDPATAITLSEHSGAVSDGLRNWIYLACDDPSVRVIDLDAGSIATLADEAAFAAADPGIGRLGGITILDASTLLVAELDFNRILAIDRVSGAVSVFAGVADAAGGFADGQRLRDARFDFSAGAGLAADGKERVLVADSGNHRLRVVQGSAVKTLAGSGLQGYLDGSPESAQFDTPLGLSLRADGGLVVTELGQRVRVLGPFGFFGTLAVSSLAGNGLRATVDGTAAPNGTASAFDPVAPVALPDGDLLWMDRGSGTLRWLVALANAVSSPLMAFSADSIFAMVVTADGSLVIFDSTAAAIVRVE